MQCFAAFIKEGKDRYERALRLCEKFDGLCKQNGYNPIKKCSEIVDEKINAFLTVEGGGAVEGSIEKLEALYRRGVRMMTLTWNKDNELGASNFSYDRSKREKEKGLTPFGQIAVEEMNRLGMLIDVSHGSDRLVADVAAVCMRANKPFLASHSGAAAVQDRPRNLEDEQIRLIARAGGVVGLDFCMDFTSDERSGKGQKKALLAHLERLVKIGGEDLPAIGSDFDGTEENIYLKNPAYMPDFFQTIAKKFGESIAEKIAYKNALRIIREVTG